MARHDQGRRGFIKGAGLATGGVLGSTVFQQVEASQAARATAVTGSMSKGARFRKSLANPAGLMIPVVNSALMCRLVQYEGYEAGLTAPGDLGSFAGEPTGIQTIDEIVDYNRQMIEQSDLPILAYVNNGGGDPLTVYKTVQRLDRAGVAVIIIEDRVDAGSYFNAKGAPLAPAERMVNRIKAAVDARKDSSVMILARTVRPAQGFAEQETLDLMAACSQVGADGFDILGFTLDQQQKAKNLLKKPLLINSDGPAAEWKAKGVDMAYYHVENIGIGAVRLALQELKTTGRFGISAKMQLPPDVMAKLVDNEDWRARAKKYGVLV